MKRRKVTNKVIPASRKRRPVVAPGGPEETDDLEDIADQDDDAILIGPPADDRSASSGTE